MLLHLKETQVSFATFFLKKGKLNNLNPPPPQKKEKCLFFFVKRMGDDTALSNIQQAKSKNLKL